MVEESKGEQYHYRHEQKTIKVEGRGPASHTHPIMIVADLLVMKIGDNVVRVVPDTFGGY
jgi:hypothetical protein